MNTYLLLFIVATVASLALTPLVRRVAQSRGWLDAPGDDRRVHRKAVPRLGGVAVFGSVLLALATLSLFDNLVTDAIGARAWQVRALLIPAGVVFLFGIYDDLRGSPARAKLLAQVFAASLFFLFGGRVAALSIPFVGSVDLPLMVSFLLTVVWVVGITNAFNLIDGMDGLATGAALFASLVLLAVSLLFGQPLVTVVTLALAGSLVGFLRYNFNPASIFLGDCGSLFIGFTLAALSVLGAQKSSTAIAVAIPLIAFGLPAVDTGFSMMRRFVGGRSIFQPDREHIHHMLLAQGLTQRQVALVLYGVCALFGLAALLFTQSAGREAGLVLFVVGVVVIIGIGHLRYHEVDEIKAGVKRTVGERRRRIANNIGIRRASRMMSQARTLAEMFAALEHLLEISEFAFAIAHLGKSEEGTRNESLLRAERGTNYDERTSPLDAARMQNGIIKWMWERADVEASDVVGSDHYWALRLPLTTDGTAWGFLNLYREFDSEALLLDTNYLCDLFQGEMSRAAARVLGAREAIESEERGLPVVARAG